MADRNESKSSEYLINSPNKETDSEQLAVARPIYLTSSPPPQVPRHEKKTEYWEDKNTGEYRKRTVTEKATEEDYSKYESVTIGNKSTGQWRTQQTQEKYTYGSGKQEFRRLPPSSSRYLPRRAAVYCSSDSDECSDDSDCYCSDSD